MKPKEGDTVELERCNTHPKHKFNSETGVVKQVYYGVVVLTKQASCGCWGFYPREIKIIRIFRRAVNK